MNDPHGHDPVSMARRVLMTRRLLSAAARRYQLTLDFCREVDKAMPVEFRPPFNPEAQPEAERRGWWDLIHEAESDFYAAESSLAERIANLYDALAPEGARVGVTAAGSEYPERGISLDGEVYILMDDPGNFEAGTPIIATVPRGHVVDLDA